MREKWELTFEEYDAVMCALVAFVLRVATGEATPAESEALPAVVRVLLELMA